MAVIRISLSLADVAFLGAEDQIVQVEDHAVVHHIGYHTPFLLYFTALVYHPPRRRASGNFYESNSFS